MKSFTRSNLIVGAALVLLTLCLLPVSASACDHSDGPKFSYCYPSIGLVSGQSLRVNLANLSRLEGREQNPVDIFAQVRLYDAQGRVVAESAEMIIPFKQFRSFNFNRAALPFPGEPGTGRLQLLVEVEMRTSDPFTFARDTGASGLFPASLELVDSNGSTVVLLPAIQRIRFHQ